MSKKPRHLKVVRGGTHESKDCDCTAEVMDFVFKQKTTCKCPNHKDFVGNVPQRWICDDCVSGKHMS